MDNFKKYFKTILLVLAVATLSGLVFYFYGYRNALKDYGITEEKETEVVEEKVEEEEKVEVEAKKLSILAGGDVMAHMPQVRAAYNGETGAYDFTGVFKHMLPLLEKSDINIANLETVVHPESELSGFPNFNSPAALVEALGTSGFTLLTTANNHSFDRGAAGVVSTIDVVTSNGMMQVGTNRDETVSRTRIVEENGFKIGFMGYTYGLNGHINDSPHLVNEIDLNSFSEDIAELEAQNVDAIILLIHWGVEYTTIPTEEQIQIANAAHELGVDYIIGSHPHVVQRFEMVGDELTMFSLGNLVSNQRGEYTNNYNTEDGMLLNINLEKDDSGEVVLSSVELIPTWVYRYNDGKWNYEIIPVIEALEGRVEGLEISEELHGKLEASLNRAKEINGQFKYDLKLDGER